MDLTITMLSAENDTIAYPVDVYAAVDSANDVIFVSLDEREVEAYVSQMAVKPL